MIVTRSFEVDSDLWHKIGLLAAVEGVSRSALVRQMLQAKVDAAPPEIRDIFRVFA